MIKFNLTVTLLIMCFCLVLPPTRADAAATPIHRQDPIMGVKIYQYHPPYEPLFSQWQTLGINTAFVSETLALDKAFMKQARMNNIAVFIIIPTFYNPETLKTHPHLAAVTAEGKKAVLEWVEFVCPNQNEYRKNHVEKIKRLVKTTQPTGISIDFIRYFTFWEKIYPDTKPNPLHNTCFCAHCLATMPKELGFTFPAHLETTPQKAEWVLTHHKEKWIAWKTRIITSMAAAIVREAKEIKPDLLTNIHIVPWRRNDFDNGLRAVTAQDVSSLSRLVDYISPMCYAHMVKQPPQWIHQVVNDLSEQTAWGTQILPSIQVKRAYLETPLTLAVFKESLRQALKPPSKGVVFWNWDALAEQKEKFEAVTQCAPAAAGGVAK